MPYADYVFANESEAAAYGELKVRFYTCTFRCLYGGYTLSNDRPDLPRAIHADVYTTLPTI